MTAGVKKLKKISAETYVPHGSTPMYDGVGLALTRLETLDDDGNEGTEINQDAYTDLTPATRLKAEMDQHIDAYHNTKAQALNLHVRPDRLAR